MNVGQLTIDIAANVARLQADMQASKKAVTDAMGDISAAVGYAKTAFIALGGVTSFAALQGIVNGSIEAKVKLYDLSLQTGITVEALSGLGKVAKYSNTDLSDIAGASNKLAKSLFTQSEESKGAAQALKALGIDFNSFKAMKPEDEMVEVAHAMSQYRDGTEKSAAAMLLYGKTGATLLPFLKELEERGYAAGKQTTESALQAKKYEDNLITLKMAADAWKRGLVDAVLPTMIDISDAFVDMRKQADSFNVAGAAVKVTFQTISVVGMTTYTALSGIGREIAAIAAQLSLLNEAATEARAKSGPLDIFGSTKFLEVWQGKRAAFNEITAAVRADGEAAAKAEQEFVDKVMGKTPKITTAGDFLRSDKDRTSVERPRLKLAEAASKDTTDADNAYAALMAKIKGKVELDQLELDSGQKVTESERFRLEVYKDVETHIKKLSVAQMLMIDGATQAAIAVMKEHEAWQAEIKWINEATTANAAHVEGLMQLRDQAQQQMRDAQEALRTYGLTTEELQALEVARQRDAAAALEQKAALADTAYLEDVARLYREQAEALRQTADAREQLARKAEFDRTDPLSGANRAVKEYLADIKRAGDATYGAVSNSVKGLEDVMVTALSGGDARGAAKAWVSGILSEIQRLYVVRPMLKQIFGDTDGNGGSGGWLGAVINLAGSFFGNGMNVDTGGTSTNFTGENLRSIGARAAGGPVTSGQSYMVGERGPELLRMGASSGSVTPMQPAQVQIHNYAGVQVGTRQDDDGTLHLLLERAADKGAERGYNRAIGDVKAGTGKFADALRSRGVNLGNAAVRRT